MTPLNEIYMLTPLKKVMDTSSINGAKIRVIVFVPLWLLNF